MPSMILTPIQRRILDVAEAAGDGRDIAFTFYLKPYIVKEIGGAPRGAVIALDRDDLSADKCPDGWEPFKRGRGRMFIGAGDPAAASREFGFGSDGEKLANRDLRQRGGDLPHNNMPPYIALYFCKKTG